MMLLVILLILSIVLNVALVFGMVRKQDEENVTFIRLRERLRIE